MSADDTERMNTLAKELKQAYPNMALIGLGATTDNRINEFSALVTSYVRPVVQKKLGTNPEHSHSREDICQETVVHVLERFAQFDENKGDFANWLHKCTQNKVMDHFRQQNHKRSIRVETGDNNNVLLNHPGRHDDPQQLAIAHETEERFNEALTALPPARAKALEHAVNGKGNQPIKSVLHNARKQAARIMGVDQQWQR